MKILTSALYSAKLGYFFESVLYQKIWPCSLSVIWHLGDLFINSGDFAMTVTMKAYFRWMLQLFFVHECPSMKEWPKSQENLLTR